MALGVKVSGHPLLQIKGNNKLAKRRKTTKKKELTFGYKGMLKKSAGKKRKLPNNFLGLF